MKKAIIAILIILSFIGCLWLLLHGHKYHIKTEFGDSFTVSDNRMFEDIFLVSDDYSKFFTSIYYFESENDFISLRDSKYFRCYQIKNDIHSIFRMGVIFCRFAPSQKYNLMLFVFRHH